MFGRIEYGIAERDSTMRPHYATLNVVVRKAACLATIQSLGLRTLLRKFSPDIRNVNRANRKIGLELSKLSDAVHRVMRCECGGDSCANMSYCLTFQDGSRENYVISKALNLCSTISPQRPARIPRKQHHLTRKPQEKRHREVRRSKYQNLTFQFFMPLTRYSQPEVVIQVVFFLQCSYAASLPKKDGKSHLLLKLLPHPLYKKSEPSLDN